VTDEFTTIVNQERFIARFRVQHFLPLHMIKGPPGFWPDQVQVIAVSYQISDNASIEGNILNQPHILPSELKLIKESIP
jgi:hypothetical protein